MAITRIWQSGFESGSIGEITANENNAWVSETQKKTGNYSVAVDMAQIADGWIMQTFPATKQVRVGFFWWTTASSHGGYVDLFAFRQSSGTYGAKIRKVGGDGGYSLQLYVNGAWRASKSGAYTHSTWIHIGVDAYIDPSAGWVKVYADGVEILSYTGNTGSFNLVDFKIGQTPAISYGLDYFDDMYVDDTTGEGSAVPCPILTFKYIVPDGAGNYTQWIPSVGNNYECVDEKPPSDSDYVSVSGIDELDSYTMDTYTLDIGETLIALIPTVRIQRGDVTEEIALGTRYSGTDLIGSDQIPGVSFSYLSERQVTKPGGGDWDQTAIDGVEILIKSRGTY